MRILVIGNGFIGGPIIKYLENYGYEVLTFSRNFNSSILSEQLIGDIENFNSFGYLRLWKPEVIINTAWITTPHVYKYDPSNIVYANFSRDLAKFSLDIGVTQVIALGSCAEYGYQVKPSLAGFTPVVPTSNYAQEKIRSYKLLSEAFINSPIRFNWARIYNPYGLNQSKERLIPSLIMAIRGGKNVELKNPFDTNDWITTRDISIAIRWIIENETPEIVDLGTGVGIQNHEIMTKLYDILGKTCPEINWQPNKTVMNRVSVASKESALIKLGWTPLDSIDYGLEWVVSEDK